VISYELYCQIRHLHQERGLNFAQIARELHLDQETVAKWARAKSYSIARTNMQRKSKLDPYKVLIQRCSRKSAHRQSQDCRLEARHRWLERHPYSAQQIFQRLRAEEAYTGGITILTDYVRTIRRVQAPAFLTLAFAPGECAQVDWGCAGAMSIGSTTRRLSFFVMLDWNYLLAWMHSMARCANGWTQSRTSAFMARPTNNPSSFLR
jgi:transposase